jgi:hypothetical protein
MVLALVDVTIGPLLTMLVFKPGKPGLLFDLIVIGILQVCALSYGTYVVFEARPAWVVFLKDRFDLVRANQIQPGGPEAKPPFDQPALTGPKVVGARIPTDPDEQFRMLVSGLSGVDISSYPRHYVAYDSVAKDAAAKARPFPALRELNPDRGAELDAVQASLGRAASDVAFLPLRAGKRDLTVLLDAKSGQVLQLTDFKPWKY